MRSVFRKFNRTQSVCYAQLHHIAQMAEVGVANYSRVLDSEFVSGEKTLNVQMDVFDG